MMALLSPGWWCTLLLAAPALHTVATELQHDDMKVALSTWPIELAVQPAVAILIALAGVVLCAEVFLWLCHPDTPSLLMTLSANVVILHSTLVFIAAAIVSLKILYKEFIDAHVHIMVVRRKESSAHKVETSDEDEADETSSDGDVETRYVPYPGGLEMYEPDEELDEDAAEGADEDGASLFDDEDAMDDEDADAEEADMEADMEDADGGSRRPGGNAEATPGDTLPEVARRRRRQATPCPRSHRRRRRAHSSRRISSRPPRPRLRTRMMSRL